MAEGDHSPRPNRARYQRIAPNIEIGPPRTQHVTPINELNKKAKKALVLQVLEEGWSYSKACRMSGTSQSTVDAWREKDPDFDKACGAHYKYGTELLEDEATRRAVHGTLEPKFYKGERIGVVRRHSDALLMFLLRGRAPEKYAKPDTVVQHATGAPALPKPALEPEQLTGLSLDDLGRLYRAKVDATRSDDK